MTQGMVMGERLVSPEYFREGKITIRSGTPENGVGISRNDIEGFGYKIPISVEENITRVSQLGLKELWLGKEPGQHNRWAHSIGAFNTAFIWLRVLEEETRIPRQCLVWPTSSWENIKALVGTAVLLHDYGHLPFAHLLNEVLESINWLPIAARWAGLEAAVLQHRAESNELKATWTWLLNEYIGKGLVNRIIKAQDIGWLVQSLILGGYGVPWIQTIVNSPIDADKIDYIRFDSDFLGKTDYPVRTRLQQERPSQWLCEFLCDQTVNHSGFLCLHGRSALAAADLWRERIFLSDRCYLAPALRVPERMAFEIIQQFLIRSTMSPRFAGVLQVGKSFPERVGENSGEVVDPIEIKYQVARDTMLEFLPGIESQDREFSLLLKMHKALQASPGIDQEYRDFLAKCFQCLEDLKGSDRAKKPLSILVSETLVQHPLILHRDDFERARELLRPLQHTYCREALIDIIRLPRVLAAPRRWRVGFGRSDEKGVDFSLLVPDGSVSTWTPRSRAATPLTDDAVKELEMPYCRIIVIAPNGARSPKAEYIWDRVRSALLEANVKLFEGGDKGMK